MVNIARRPVLVGELNPYGTDPKYALYPYPERSAGGRLCRKVLELNPSNYLRSYARINLCTGKWSVKNARAKAGALVLVEKLFPDNQRVFILCGVKVSVAFGFNYIPFTVECPDWAKAVVILPHPSGLCRIWNQEGSYHRAREVLRSVGAL